MIPALLAPLLSQGLTLIGNAVMAKGKDWVEDKTGVKLNGPLSDADAMKLKQYEMDHEEELLRLRIEEKKLDFLNAAQHRNLFKKGVMGRIYTHLLSLDNFARLMARKNTVAAAA